jgi:hypothetical protein
MHAEFNEAQAHQHESCKTGDGSAPETLAALRRFARSRPEIERCELCGAGLAPEHPHLLQSVSRRITCSCEACAILFCGQERAKFLRVPRRILQLESFGFDDLAWEAMLLPINLAFFLREPDGRTAVFYPSPAGAMSSLIDLPRWNELFGSESGLASLEPEVVALLVNRVGGQAAHFVVPIDECYRLVGLIRTKWRGLSGGPDVWQAVADFFTSLERRATRIGKATHA